MQINAMVVDDSGIMRKLVMRSLLEAKLADFIFIEAKDGLDALSRFDAKTTQMMFVDWNMPNMNGIDLVRKIRSIQAKHVHIVMITTESTMGKIEEALDQAGADCFIIKPFTSEIVRKKLEPLFDRISETLKKPGGFFSNLVAKIN
jgi:two-component system, chemotaxis family, chemotaxis protein CheY